MKREAIELLERVLDHLRKQMDAKDAGAHEDYRAWSLVMDLKGVHQNTKWARDTAKRAKSYRAWSEDRMRSVLDTVSRYSERHNTEKWEVTA